MDCSISDDRVYDLFLQCDGVTTDTRKIVPGALFIALKGANFNGNEFAAKAVDGGCRFAVVDEPAFADGVRIFAVDNCLATLQSLARIHRRRLGTTVIGITGTNGKTTTKELVSACLRQKFNVLFTQGNLNNHIGVPLTVLGLRPEHQIAVVEMGASHPGDIRELVNIAEPDCGLITNVGKAHILGFGSFQGVVNTKGELYDFLRSRPSGFIFRNSGNQHLQKISLGLRQVLYGPSPNDFVCGSLLGADPFLRLSWQDRTICTHLVGGYNFENVLAAIAVASYFGVAPDDICRAIEEYVPSNNRSQFVATDRGNRLIVDAYNANPTSMAAALDNFAAQNPASPLLVLGDMKELGQESDAEHRRVVDWVLSHPSFRACLVGDCFCRAAKEAGISGSGVVLTFASTGLLEDWLRLNAPSGSSVLIKGSNSMHLSSLVGLF